MTHKEKQLDNKRRKGCEKKREKYEKNGKYNRRKIENNSILVEKENYTVVNIGKSRNKKGVPIVID